jgi:hypothetical protein
MKIELINQWRDVSVNGINCDFDYLQIHQEYSVGYLAFYVVILGLGVEIILKGN